MYMVSGFRPATAGGGARHLPAGSSGLLQKLGGVTPSQPALGKGAILVLLLQLETVLKVVLFSELFLVAKVELLFIDNTMIITIGGIKGGSGKTTIATNLVVQLLRQGRDVLLVDADDQESATDFSAFRHRELGGSLGYTAVKLTGRELHANVGRLATKYDDVVIDTGGRDTVSQRSALTVAHSYLVPFAPRSLDIWTLRRVENLIAEVSPFNPGLRCLTFINKADARGTAREEAAELLRSSASLRFLPAAVGNRISFANATAAGLGVAELRPPDEKAIAELEELCRQVQLAST
jgi:chromosome partitioning protein